MNCPENQEFFFDPPHPGGCYINIIGIIPAYACNVLNVCDAFVQILQPLANVHETKWTGNVKHDCDVAVRCVTLPFALCTIFSERGSHCIVTSL